jgi:hypothetical protein
MSAGEKRQTFSALEARLRVAAELQRSRQRAERIAAFKRWCAGDDSVQLTPAQREILLSLTPLGRRLLAVRR